jgi:Ca2+-binding EF-hand superfamily protein
MLCVCFLYVPPASKRHFKLAFKMFDVDGDGVLSRTEFEEVHSIIKKGTTVGARHRDHAVTGSVAMGVSDAVTTYLFGKDGHKQLSYQEFEEFQNALNEACLRIEFGRFEPDEDGHISEHDFAKLILSHAEFEHQEEKRYLKRLKQKFDPQEMKGVTFHQVCQFSIVLDNIADIDKAMVLYEAGKAALTEEDFKHLAKTVTGVALDDHVIKIIFALFDENNDEELSHKEFVEVMKKRKTLGLGKKKELGFVRLLSAVAGCGNAVLTDFISSKLSSSK